LCFGLLSLQDPDLGVLCERRKADTAVRRRTQAVCSGSFGRRFSVVSARVDTQYAANVVSVAGNAELAKRIAPLVQEDSDGLADLVLAVLGVMACTADGVDGSARGALV